MNLKEIRKEMAQRALLSLIEVGPYSIEIERFAGNICRILSFSINGQTFSSDEYEKDKVLELVKRFCSPETPASFMSERDLENELEYIWRYNLIQVPGYYLIAQQIIGKTKVPNFRMPDDEELAKILKKSRSFDRPIMEIENYLQTHKFRMRSCLAYTTAKRMGGSICLVKVIDPNTGQRNTMLGSPQLFEQVMTGRTGVPTIDALYPLGTSTGMVTSATFLYCDEAAFRGNGEDKLGILIGEDCLKARFGPWPEDRIPKQFKNLPVAPSEYPPTPETFERFQDFYAKYGNQPHLTSFTDRSGMELFYVPLMGNEERMSRMSLVTTVKRFVMPCNQLHFESSYFATPSAKSRVRLGEILEKSKKPLLRGIILDRLTQYDGIIAFMPATYGMQLMAASGYISDVTMLQCASSSVKGCIRFLPDHVWESEFGLPLDVDTIRVVFNPKAIKQERRARLDLEAREHRLSMCENPGCSWRWLPLSRNVTKCPGCATPTISYPACEISSDDIGIFSDDAAAKKPYSNVSRQLVARGLPDKNRIKGLIRNELAKIQRVIDLIYTKGNAIEDSFMCEGKVVSQKYSVVEKILEYDNMSQSSLSSFQSAMVLIKMGMAPFHPQVIGRVANLLAKVALKAKCTYKLANKVVANEKGMTHVKYGYRLAAPGIGLKQGECRIPLDFKPIVDANGYITIVRNPNLDCITESDSRKVRTRDSFTAKVVDWSFGNVVELHPEDWATASGDFDGDLAGILPTWATGFCKQGSRLEGLKGENINECDIMSVSEVVDAAYKTLTSKAAIGIEDNRVTRIVFERICKKQNLSDEEKTQLRQHIQRVIEDFKPKHNIIQVDYSDQLEKDFLFVHDHENPVNAILFFNPEKLSSPPTLSGMLLEFVRDTGHKIPYSKDQYLDWWMFLRDYWIWVLNVWLPNNKKLAYQIFNHPYYEIVDDFISLEFTSLIPRGYAGTPYENKYSIIFNKSFMHMYTPIFTAILKELDPLVNASLDIMAVNELKEYALVVMEMYTKLTQQYAEQFDVNSEEGFTSTMEWSEVTRFLHGVVDKEGRIQKPGVVHNLADIMRRVAKPGHYDMISMWFFSLLGAIRATDFRDVLGYNLRTSLIWKVAPTELLQRVFRVYNDQYPEYDEETRQGIEKYFSLFRRHDS